MPESLLDIKYPHQIKIAEILNVKRGDRQDFRLVAHHLGFHTSLILTASETLNPMMTIFEHCARVKGQVLVEALFKCKRFDAMKVIVENYFSGKCLLILAEKLSYLKTPWSIELLILS